MESSIRSSVLVCFAVLAAVGAYRRIASHRSGEPLDRSKEGWPLMIGIRAFGLADVIQTVLVLKRSSVLDWAKLPLPLALRWGGVGLLAAASAWLCWMFVSLGQNLTDTVVTRRDATFVEHGPYRYVRNPMYSGLLIMGLAIGMALENASIPVTTLAVFVLLAIRTRTEEKYLIARFGDTYRDYMRRVGRFLP
jgi:protein-S-isoprenylcysteine O-methyltransferase Ste14